MGTERSNNAARTKSFPRLSFQFGGQIRYALSTLNRGEQAAPRL
jgi:hypothetical protein